MGIWVSGYGREPLVSIDAACSDGRSTTANDIFALGLSKLIPS